MPSVPREKYPEMNWRAADKVAAWKVFKRRMEVIFVADQIPEERQWALILVAGGNEAYNRWDTLEDTVKDCKVVQQVWDAFEKSFEQSTSFWHFRDAYLADFRQDKSETTADLDLRIKQTVRGCQWKKETEEERMIDLLYHATIYYEIRKFVQESDPAALTYEMVIEKAKAHERNVLEYKDHQASHGGANSAPSYNNPLLSAHTLSKRQPSGCGNNGQRCGKCGKSHERGNCPAYGKTCDRCKGINHFKAVCRSKVTAKTTQSPHRSKKSQPPRRGSTGSYNGQGKGGGNRQHQKKKTPKKPPKQNAYAVTMKNSVPSEVTTTSGGEREKHGNVSSKMVLSGPEEEGTYNRFSCFAVHSKMSQSTNAKSKPTEGLYTDTDPDNRSEIITDVTIRMPGKAGTMMMEVKVDPGAQPSCITLHKFKTLFPHLCRDGLPKEGLLDNTQNEFQSYNGGDMTCYGHILIDVKDKVTKKYHPIRFYVMNTDVPRILISHAASYWLGLVRVLCDNKAPRIKRSQVPKEPLQPHDIPEGPWKKLGIDYFTFDGNSYVLICDYFSKFPFLYRAKTSFWSLRDRLIDLFSIEGYPDEIVSDNGPPFQSKEFAKFLSSLGIKHTTSSPGYSRSNGFIERHIQTVKNMLSKSSNTRSFQEVLADLRTTRIGTGLPSPAEILHGRNLTTRAQADIDIKAIRSVLQERQLKMTLDHDSSRRAKKARLLVVGERCHVLGPGNKWIDAFVTGITDSGRSYETQVEATGKHLTRNRSHIRPRRPDIPHIHASFLQRNAVPSATSDGNAPSERQNSVISGRQQLANGQKTVLSGNRKGSIKQTNTPQVLVSETVPDRRVQPSRRAKMTRFGDNPVTSTVSIPPRRQPGCDTSTRNRRDFKLNVTDPDLLIPIKQTVVTSRHSDLREP